MPQTAEPDYWNHNVHYQPFILRAVPPGCAAALDVGCGDGRLARLLATRCQRVTGVDRDAAMIAIARRRGAATPQVSFLEQDFLTAPLKRNSFDFICSVTAVHHLDFAAALTRMRELTRPGGRIAIIGLARDAAPADVLWTLAATPVNLVLRAVHGESDPGAPVAEPHMTWAEVRAAAADLLPGSVYRRHLLWRYSLRWRKPG